MKALALVVSSGTLLLLCSCGHRVEAETHADATKTVAVAQVKTETLSRNLALTAEFKPYQEIDVMAKVAGYVKQINVDIGDRVKQGQPLATLEIPEMGDDLRKAQSGVDQSEAEVQRAKDELQRAESVHEIAHLGASRLDAVAKQRPGLVAQQEIDDARGKDLVSEAQVSAAKSALAAARQHVTGSQADVAKVKTLLDYTRVTAPFAGVVVKRYADTGSMIQAGTASQTQAMPLVRIADNSMLRLILPVPESAVPTIHVGQQVEVRVPSLNRTFPGRVARSANQLSLQTRTMDTEVDVRNPSLVLVPGMYAEVDLTLNRRNAVLAIPLNAVDTDAEGLGRVMVVTPNNRVEVRKIALGLESASDVEVRSGLNEGDMVVISGRAALQPGEEVHPKVTVMAAAKQ